VEVAELAQFVASRCGSLGIALDSVTVPGSAETNDRLDENTIEIGLGIHGEAGMKQSHLLTADEMAREMITTIQNYGRVFDNFGHPTVVPMFEDGANVCVLVNNLGGASNFEMSILAKSCITLLEGKEFGVSARRVFVGSYMTSFNMHGASLTILNLDSHRELMELLDAPTNAPAWSPCDVWIDGCDVRPSCIEVPEIIVSKMSGVAGATEIPVTMSNFESVAMTATMAAVNKLAEAEPILTKYDTIVGDGDCGITMKRGAMEIHTRLQNGTITTLHPIPMFVGLADAVSASMGGTSGILLELMLRKMGSTLSRVDSIGMNEMCASFQAGVDAVSLYGGAQIGSRTMLDALIPAAKVLVETKNISLASIQARQGADGTASMKEANAGRSNYLSEETLDGTPDPGAVAAAIVLESLASSFGN
jgi:triose/dihydroxyacetone kinase / FAD-AMP lyase (cyclizing)